MGPQGCGATWMRGHRDAGPQGCGAGRLPAATPSCRPKSWALAARGAAGLRCPPRPGRASCCPPPGITPRLPGALHCRPRHPQLPGCGTESREPKVTSRRGGAVASFYLICGFKVCFGPAERKALQNGFERAHRALGGIAAGERTVKRCLAVLNT